MNTSRIKRRADFVRIANSARRSARPSLVLQANPTDDSEVRVGFTVTKKVGNAVVRNRVRRRLKAAFSEVAPKLPSGEYVVIGRLGGIDRPYSLLVEDMKSAAASCAAPKQSRRSKNTDGSK